MGFDVPWVYYGTDSGPVVPDGRPGHVQHEARIFIFGTIWIAIYGFCGNKCKYCPARYRFLFDYTQTSQAKGEF